MKYYSVAILSPPYTTLTYICAEFLPAELYALGMRVAVPLGGKSLRAGIIFAISEDRSQIPENVKIKEMLWPLEHSALFDATYLDLIRDLAIRQSLTPGHILGHILPVGLRTTNVRLRYFGVGKPEIFSLKAAIDLTLERKKELGQAILAGKADIIPKKEDAALGEICFLLKDPPWPVRPSAHKQRALLEHILAQGPQSRRALLKEHGAGMGVALNALLQNNLVGIKAQDEEEIVEAEKLLPPIADTFELSAKQKDAVNAFKIALNKNEAASFLLFGVTGSGKTAVYLNLARECLASGKNMLLLAPEVALALKLRRDAEHALPDVKVFFFHGYQSPALRERIFAEIAIRKAPCIIVGARSALFLPINNLGAIVLDEEHDSAFKQDEGFIYQAKEIAWFRVQQSKGILVLGSATPDIKTFNAVENGFLPMLPLPSRVGGGTLPEIKLVNISKQAGSSSLLAPESIEAIKETLARNEQIVVLLNRRGYAPIMYCLDCNTVPRCPHCEIGLTYHKGRERLICHYCDYSQPYPSFCIKCNGMNFLPMGEGTERLAETLTALAQPDKKILRLDRDTTRRPGRMEEILQSFAQGEAHILVGTQMLSKGHHFPGVTLALIADGDIGLNLPDYRAAERTFQLLVQAAGRAGRGEKAGKVIIQTRDTSHYCWKHIAAGDFEGFYAEELAKRKLRNYPPFTRLALLRISFAFDYPAGHTELSAFGEKLRLIARKHGVMVLGPAPAPLAMLRGRRRFNCLLKCADWASIRTVFAEAVDKNKGQNLRFYLDLDPVNML